MKTEFSGGKLCFIIILKVLSSKRPLFHYCRFELELALYEPSSDRVLILSNDLLCSSVPFLSENYNEPEDVS